MYANIENIDGTYTILTNKKKQKIKNSCCSKT